FVDDTLTQHQLDVICGVYRVLGSNVSEVAYHSWWPSSSTWNSCGLSTDCWTEHNERWFLGHLRKILSGEFQPLNASGWR
ncbi:hypothetical protein BDY19DRAFT_868677, partial [Irpex rosettiformis]